MISIRREIEVSGHVQVRFQALLKIVWDLVSALPRTALPANPDLAGKAAETLGRVTALLKEGSSVEAIEETGRVSLRQIEEICEANKTAVEERDAALKEMVASVAAAVSSFRGQGERHNSNLSKVAEGFDALSRVEDVAELRRRLREDVHRLSRAVEEMHRDGEESVRQFESQLSSFQQRLEMARKGAVVDRLTGVGSRRDAERNMQNIPKYKGPVCLLVFDIEGFGEINRRHGTPFGDKLLQALAHTLRASFPSEVGVFRWGADEFVIIVEGTLPARMEQCCNICAAFGRGRYLSLEAGRKVRVSGAVACGAAQYTRGESMEELYRRSRDLLERSRSRVAQ
jgi:diguanylate cyclase (GGDEF)-like protein